MFTNRGASNPALRFRQGCPFRPALRIHGIRAKVLVALAPLPELVYKDNTSDTGEIICAAEESNLESDQ